MFINQTFPLYLNGFGILKRSLARNQLNWLKTRNNDHKKTWTLCDKNSKIGPSFIDIWLIRPRWVHFITFITINRLLANQNFNLAQIFYL